MIVAHTFLRRLPYFILLALFYLLAASQAIQSFSYKWTTIAVHKQYSLDKTLKFETPKPYAYRVFMPAVVNMVVDAAPGALLQQLIDRSKNTLQANIGGEVQMMSNKVIASHAVIILFDYIFLLVTFWVLRAAGKITTRGNSGDAIANVVTDLGPVLFAFMLALSYRVYNGFIYDHLELLCLSLYMLFSLQRNLLMSICAVAVAIFNKETAIFFPLFGASIYLARTKLSPGGLRTWFDSASNPKLLIKLFFELLVVVSGYVFVHFIFHDALGGPVEFHGPKNFWFWFSLAPWISFTTPHLQLIPLPKPTNILVILPIILVVFGVWNKKPSVVRLPLIVSMAVNIPLFFLFSYRDEFRNLSFVFPFAYLSAIHTMINYYENSPFAGK